MRGMGEEGGKGAGRRREETTEEAEKGGKEHPVASEEAF